jgi:hypothetical protein
VSRFAEIETLTVAPNLTMLRINRWQLCVWRDGDTIANVGAVMIGTLNQDRARTVASFQRSAALDVETACFGHGEPTIAGASSRIREVAVRT